MFAGTIERRGRRRGIVLVLILGMLGLMSLIGVTFATFAGQAQVNSRNFRLGLDRPGAEALMDYALAQLINDTNNPLSALRGHSLLRDMYGNDSKLAGNAAKFGGVLASLPNGVPLSFEDAQTYNGTNPALAGGLQFRTNIPVNANPALVGLNFNRWLVRLNPIVYPNDPPLGNQASWPANLRPILPAQTVEVLEDDDTGGLGAFAHQLGDLTQPINHVLTLSAADAATFVNHLYNYPAISGAEATAQLNTAPFGPPISAAVAAGAVPLPLSLTPLLIGQTFQLDGRFLNAFNGPGVNHLTHTYNEPNGYIAGIAGTTTTPPSGTFPNFRINGAVLDSSVATPTASIPGDPNFVGMDEDYDAADLENWFLAIQSADGRVMIPSFHRPGIIRVQYDNAKNLVYSDWQNGLPTAAARFLRPRAFDHPASGLRDLLADPETGLINYDVDNDGDGVSDSVWLDLGYPPQRDAGGRMYKPLFAFMVLGLNGRMPLNTAGNLQQRDFAEYVYTGGSGGTLGTDLPTFDHTSHVGTSPSEINPKFALQVTGTDVENVDNGGVPIWRTQLRNLLAGTRPQPDLHNLSLPLANGDINSVTVGGSLGLTPQTFFMPNGVVDAADRAAGTVNPTPIVDALSRLDAPPVAGRWGEADFVPSILYDSIQNLRPFTGTVRPENLNWTNPVRAGKSAAAVNPPSSFEYGGDLRDDNRNAVDMYPYVRAAGAPYDFMHPEFYNDLDRSGGLKTAAERNRRFVTPVDVAGIGRITRYNNTDGAGAAPIITPNDPFGVGADARGRVSFYRYFRPAGTPGNVANGTNWVAPVDDATAQAPALNPYHGYDRFRMPKGLAFSATPAGPMGGAWAMGGMPLDLPQPPPAPDADLRGSGTPLTSPTFAAQGQINPPHVHSGPTYRELLGFSVGYAQTRNALPMGSPGVDEADEMNLYEPGTFDAPFGFADLEWLYRRHDVDGAALNSRLGQLAPVSFLNAIDGLTRRRMFSVDTWETNQLIWSADNPSNAFPNNSLNAVYPAPGVGPRGQLNLLTGLLSNGSYEAYGAAQGQIQTLYTGGGVVYPAVRAKPPLMHRDRKINLNYPLPISNDPNEPVRQKWVANAYEMLKVILPPRATDTPEELAELSQFLVNVVDFRDGDATCTRFVNADITPVAASRTAHGRVAFNTGGGPGVEQFGMEHLPVTINEVLAFQTKYKQGQGDSAQDTVYPRMYIELVNMLQDPAGQTHNSDLDLTGWRVMIAPDTPLGRPHPVTGQLDLTTLNTEYPGVVPVPIAETSPTTPLPNRLPALGRGEVPPAPQTIASADNHSRYYYVMANGRPAAMRTPQEYFYQKNEDYPLKTGNAGQENAPDFTLSFDPASTSNTGPSPRLMNELFIDETGASTYPMTDGATKFKWLYLLRPANPFDPASPLVVADAMRFPFAAITGTGDTQRVNSNDRESVTQDTATVIYTASRLQPYRGGHLIRPDDDGNETAGTATPPSPIDPYGYSEQTGPSNGDRFHLIYESAETDPARDNDPNRLSRQIRHTIGKQNDRRDDVWDHFPFHDRDFQSVAELLLVPGCPPGLFTKKFVEHPGPQIYPVENNTPGSGRMMYYTTDAYPTSEPNNLDEGRQFPKSGLNAISRTYPYLSDKFYYTAADGAGAHPGGSHLTGVPGTVDGYTSAGWHKMFALFEVPSPAMGSTGLVQDGVNFDWLRQDRRPGMLNLNLIVDQEVFLGLLDEPRLNLQVTPAGMLPRVATQVNVAGYPTTVSATTVQNWTALVDPAAPRGFFYPNTDDGPGRNAATTDWHIEGAPIDGLSQAFSDFLKLRHGGSGFLFAFGQGATGSGPAPTPANPDPTTLPGFVPAVAAERPFRSPSFPDINYTVMRPAPLPPSALTNPPLNTAMPALSTLDAPQAITQYYAADLGVKNPYLSRAYQATDPATILAPTLTSPEDEVPQPPPVPPRRLFALPDVTNLDNSIPTEKYNGIPNRQPEYNSNAAMGALTATFDIDTTFDRGQPEVNVPIEHPNLSNPFGGLMQTLPGEQFANGRYLGANNDPAIPTPDPEVDTRAHPAYRTQMLQKVMNLTTVRTHQFAVWITVGFFEVLRPGNSNLGVPQPDLLGPEIGINGGDIVRHRSFFVLDRTRAVGFNPVNPIDFREVVVYRRPIE